MDRQAVLQAAREAFDLTPDQVRDYLETAEDGRVRGFVVVVDSPGFDGTRAFLRARRLWDRLRRSAGAEPPNVGAVILLSEAEAAASGLVRP